MHREEIKAQLRIKFGNLSAFEDARGLPRRSVTDVLRGRTVERTADAIAAEFGTTVQDLLSQLSTKVDASADQAATHRLNAAAQ